MSLPTEILAFKLLRSAGLRQEEKLVVLTGMDYDKRDTIFEKAQKSLKKFKGGGFTGGSGISGAAAIKVEPTYETYSAERRGRGRFDVFS
jgi:hypothetical protein